MVCLYSQTVQPDSVGDYEGMDVRKVQLFEMIEQLEGVLNKSRLDFTVSIITLGEFLIDYVVGVGFGAEVIKDEALDEMEVRLWNLVFCLFIRVFSIVSDFMQVNEVGFVNRLHFLRDPLFFVAFCKVYFVNLYKHPIVIHVYEECSALYEYGRQNQSYRRDLKEIGNGELLNYFDTAVACYYVLNTRASELFDFDCCFEVVSTIVESVDLNCGGEETFFFCAFLLVMSYNRSNLNQKEMMLSVPVVSDVITQMFKVENKKKTHYSKFGQIEFNENETAFCKYILLARDNVDALNEEVVHSYESNDSKKTRLFEYMYDDDYHSEDE